ncbi:DUF2891 domain-containing protein [Streptomyces sp. DSM 42041]|uniref:DUF2891 domain-containing protein n=1 Tax=Streptomyces hazeniae TaxID=3075538 RepID=A0ABU2NZP3_9ACTN|nr:DUF2891 domain-containing protein [Streptomyces sp. DSM 42041]MDT0382454.1 DUF2891 domain-containing protein [Streptomyces sp. DSM 42041]
MSTAPGRPPSGRPHLAAYAAAFARTALANITREYPNAPAHLLAGPHELVPPRDLHPAFHGAYDWHSAVHMHWLLVRLLRHHPDRIPAGAVTAALDAHLTPAALDAEAAYLRAHPSFERPYGWAWLLLLTAECAALRTPDGARWASALTPAARTVAGLFLDWLPRATYPVRHGTHANSAFALGLVLDSAAAAGVAELAAPVGARLHTWFADDHDAALRWEPSGQDFLSPLLAEADVMRRVLQPPRFATWLTAFLPELSSGRPEELPPPEVSDPADPQIGHLLGLCLHRAAALQAVAAALPPGDPRRAALDAAADAHLHVALPATDGDDFTLGHWLATFAALALGR